MGDGWVISWQEGVSWGELYGRGIFELRLQRGEGSDWDQSSQDLFDGIEASNWVGEEKRAVAWEGQLLGSGEFGLRWNGRESRNMRTLLAGGKFTVTFMRLHWGKPWGGCAGPEPDRHPPAGKESGFSGHMTNV